MSISAYISDRVDGQIHWYDNKSAKQKRWFYRARFLTLLFSAGIPILTGMVPTHPVLLTWIAILGGAIAVIEGCVSFTKVHEKWIQYRSIAENLKREKHLFMMSAGIYNSPDADANQLLFVERVESTISEENNNWANMGKSVNNVKGRK